MTLVLAFAPFVTDGIYKITRLMLTKTKAKRSRSETVGYLASILKKLFIMCCKDELMTHERR